MREPRLAEIRAAVASVFELPESQMVGQRRHRPISRARQAYYLLARELTSASFPKIAYYLGGRDHTTAMHGTTVAAGLVEIDPGFRRLVALSRTALRGDGALYPWHLSAA